MFELDFDALKEQGIQMMDTVQKTAQDLADKGKTQMELYSKIQNPLRFRDREDAVRFWEREIPGYKEANDRIKAIDNE